VAGRVSQPEVAPPLVAPELPPVAPELLVDAPELPPVEPELLVVAPELPPVVPELPPELLGVVPPELPLDVPPELLVDPPELPLGVPPGGAPSPLVPQAPSMTARRRACRFMGAPSSCASRRRAFHGRLEESRWTAAGMVPEGRI
jgi:hypothetical protein